MAREEIKISKYEQALRLLAGHKEAGVSAPALRRMLGVMNVPDLIHKLRREGYLIDTIKAPTLDDGVKYDNVAHYFYRGKKHG